MSTLSTDDYLGITLALAIITILLAPRRCLSWSCTLLASYHAVFALLARTEIFIFLIFLSLLVGDVCHATVRVIEPLVVKLGLFNRPIAQAAPNSAQYAAISLSAPVNNQLRTWMKEDAEKIWKSMADARDQEAKRSQELRAMYRELASLMPDHEISDWPVFETEAIGSIGP
ncbi:hypothetical protein MBLNU13_g02089t1 [Cladosporium sp. NU13]